jgi:hypothetical protein
MGYFVHPSAVCTMNDKELLTHLDAQIKDFAGDLTSLERAVGAAIVGRQFGWKVLLLVHDRKTIARYEETLALDFRQEMPEVGPLAKKSVGWLAAQKVASFWKAVKGAYPNVKSVNVR